LMWKLTLICRGTLANVATLQKWKKKRMQEWWRSSYYNIWA
jgi:hypothetical protein